MNALCVTFGWQLQGECIKEERQRDTESFMHRPELQGRGESRFYTGDHTDTRAMGKKRTVWYSPTGQTIRGRQM